jgi:rubrerythrin
MALFNMRDVFAIAVKIEERGEAFYRQVAEKVEGESVKKLLNSLADDEVQHKQLFTQMASQIGETNLAHNLEESYLNYLQAYTETLVFEDPDKLPYDAKQAFDLPRAIMYAIEKELDSVLFYKEVKDLIPPSEQGLLDKIINEERRHVVNLHWLKNQLTA